jgi:hypothetical protein
MRQPLACPGPNSLDTARRTTCGFLLLLILCGCDIETYTPGDPGAQDGCASSSGRWSDDGWYLGVWDTPQDWIGLRFVISTEGKVGAAAVSLTPVLQNDAGGMLIPYLVAEANAEPYSELLPPGSRDEIQVGVMVPVLPGEHGDTLIPLDMDVLSSVTEDPDWRGVISLSLHWWGGQRVWRAWEHVVPDSPWRSPPTLTIVRLHSE